MGSGRRGRVLCPSSGQTYFTRYLPGEQRHRSYRYSWQIGGLTLFFLLAAHLALTASAATMTPALSPATTLETPAPVPAKVEAPAEEDESSEEGESSSEDGATVPVVSPLVPGQSSVNPDDPLRASSGAATEGEGAPGGVRKEEDPLAPKITPLRASRVARRQMKPGSPLLRNMAKIYAGLTLLAVSALVMLAGRRSFSEDVRSPTATSRPYLRVTLLTLIAIAVAFFFMLKLGKHGLQPGSVRKSAEGLE